MHQKVYTHKAVKQIEFMVTDVMMLANEEIKISGSKTAKFPDGMYSLSNCIECPKAFCNLNDSILDIVVQAKKIQRMTSLEEPRT